MAGGRRLCDVAAPGDGRAPNYPRRIQMRFMMVDADEWLPQRKCNGLRGFKSDEQCHWQTRTLRGGNGVNFGRDALLRVRADRQVSPTNSSFGQSSSRNGQEI